MPTNTQTNEVDFIFIFPFITVGCLLGAPVKDPFPNFAAVIVLWTIYYLLTGPGRRPRQYWRERRRPEEEYMRAYLRNNRFR